MEEEKGSGRKVGTRSHRIKAEMSDPAEPGREGTEAALGQVTPESPLQVTLWMTRHQFPELKSCCTPNPLMGLVAQEDIYGGKVFESLDPFWIVCEVCFFFFFSPVCF